MYSEMAASPQEGSGEERDDFLSPDGSCVGPESLGRFAGGGAMYAQGLALGPL